ncbi:hypothetical protein J1N35_004257 [Gossypium stocksii]|uniref:MPN domain-containing protein n=1 Tax=Gossypium stocksii TaxID=47602 RepID=A0A9D4AFX4_9ROSI|nr:hypothetical protein J1N35_004257 [Gossypium stocksii]
MAKYSEDDKRWIVEERPGNANVHNWHWAEIEHRVAATEEVASPLRIVQIEGLVILKIIKHCKEFSPALVTGQLLGLDVGSVLEVINWFSFPIREEDEEIEDDGANYQLEMMRCLREVNVDNNIVGWCLLFCSFFYYWCFDSIANEFIKSNLRSHNLTFLIKMPDPKLSEASPCQMVTTSLTHHTYLLSKLLYLSSTLALPQALTIFNQIPNQTIFLYNTLISSVISSTNRKCETHLAFSLYERVLWDKTIRPNSHTYPSLFKACGSHLHGLALHA